MKPIKVFQIAMLLVIVLAAGFTSCEKEKNEDPNLNKDTVKDIEGNVYKTVTIGLQTWMSENLKATKYANGTAIPQITDGNAWGNLRNNDTHKAYCFYNNDASLGYGVLYTYAAASNEDTSGVNVQGVCPTGWHLPSDEEWTVLENYLDDNGYNYDGSSGGRQNKIAKAMANQTGWNNSSDVGDVGNDSDSNNGSGFAALPAGSRSNQDGKFYGSGNSCTWWSSSSISSTGAYIRGLYYKNYGVQRYGATKSAGFSVRCIKD